MKLALFCDIRCKYFYHVAIFFLLVYGDFCLSKHLFFFIKLNSLFLSLMGMTFYNTLEKNFYFKILKKIHMFSSNISFLCFVHYILKWFIWNVSELGCDILGLGHEIAVWIYLYPHVYPVNPMIPINFCYNINDYFFPPIWNVTFIILIYNYIYFWTLYFLSLHYMSYQYNTILIALVMKWFNI